MLDSTVAILKPVQIWSRSDGENPTLILDNSFNPFFISQFHAVFTGRRHIMALPLAVRRLLAWAVPAVDIPPAASYRRVGDCDWEAEWGDQESEEDDEEDGVELPVVIV